ncbi:GlxA family transcriptional regulator [Undibacterium sp. TJN19]|uniref:GlxA family transcriptional regulator n=1 Tax=Undibacterium sp. TJN19 TaxID=3413055 RepID=UPI003BF2BDE2
MPAIHPEMTSNRVARVIALVVFPGVQLLDVAGPGDVFSMAEQFSVDACFDVVLVSASGGLIATTSGIEIHTRCIRDVASEGIDTLILAGGSQQGLIAAIKDAELSAWVCRAAATARRFGSVCAGSFALAQWGLLDARKATTHWSVSALLGRLHPHTAVEADAIYIRDGRIWTSGGVTSGIDMCLAMVEEDLGLWVAARIAKQMILPLRRLGNQSQFSSVLEAQAGRYATLVDWVRAHIRESIDVNLLAAHVGESVRSFHRHFQAETGQTPAAFIEALRLQLAREQLDAGESLKTAARLAGFTSEQHLSKVFLRRSGMTAAQYRSTHKINMRTQEF